jgi:hypothetical protein
MTETTETPAPESARTTIAYVVAGSSNAPQARSGRLPDWVVAWIVLGAVIAAGVLGTGAYFVGRATGDDIDAARSAAQREGQAVGEQRGRKSGLRAGKRDGYSDAYRKAYRRAYRSAFEKTASGR